MAINLKRIIKNRLYKDASLAYAQEGEDMMLARIFWEKKEGFYIDVGAHHPTKFSNTQYFYNLGWRGINIDALPGSMKIFNKERKRDINLEIPISDKQEKLTYYVFNYHALNSFSPELSKERNGLNDWKIVKEIELTTQPLSEVLDIHLPKGQSIDFLTIDVEGYDYKVLKSNNWEKYRPAILLIEDLNNLPIKQLSNSEVYNYIESCGYELIAKSFYTLLFKNIY